ncbi:MAG: glycine--tRNA ligase subunit beta [Planctomycetota bacterium]|jgi:glycyl-tRNA synthetase beta chain
MPDLLLELGVEESPAGYIPGALSYLASATEAALKDSHLEFTRVRTTATPRRLVVSVTDLPQEQPPREEVVAGPPESVAFKDGEPTPAGKGFAKKNGIDASALFVEETPKGRYVFANKRTEGQPTSDVLRTILPQIVRSMPWPKSMRWPQAEAPTPLPAVAPPTEGGKKKKKKKKKGVKRATFARPLRRVMCLLGNRVVEVEVFGERGSRMTQGHPFLSGERRIALERADYAAYRALLRGHVVIADRDERRELIRAGLTEAFSAHGGELRHPDLLEEVTDLVEYPHVLAGHFAERYLELLPEVVDAAMTEHQRYFPIYGEDGALKPAFLFVANRTGKDLSAIVKGNERVLRARLEDAYFYLAEDLKHAAITERKADLERVTFHNKLGSLWDRTERLVTLTGAIATGLGLSDDARSRACRAAELCKADLTTDLVAEFPKLQGVIGADYARRAKEPEAVARAIRDHYSPRYSGDGLPGTPEGTAVALADKLDQLACFFAAGLGPTGSTDPFALRRQAIGCVRLIAEKELALSIQDAIGAAIAGVPEGLMDAGELRATLTPFLGERFAQTLKDGGARYDLVDAVLAARAIDDFRDTQARTQALTRLSTREDFPALTELVERTYNISKALDDKASGVVRQTVDESLLCEDEERALYQAWAEVKTDVASGFAAGSYEEAAAKYLAALKTPVHAFFEKVFVNVEDLAVRQNRLSLLREIHDAFATTFANLCHVVAQG